jgi:DNA-directed RNA polymerase alpha subunit
MEPVILQPIETDDVYTFTLAGVDVSIANAIRRTILSDIDTVVFYTETYEDNKCIIEKNTSRLHNEIIKQRLSCIPIHIKQLDLLPNNYILEVDVENNTDNIKYVTTEDFRIRNKTNTNYLTVEETRSIFPLNPKTNSYIDFVRLRPKIGDYIPGEHLKLICDFSISNAKDSSMFNVVSKCTYSNTMDLDKINTIWEQRAAKLIADDIPANEIEFQKKNYYILDAQRTFKENSFDFAIQTLGIFNNNEIVSKACIILHNKFANLIEQIQSDIVPIQISSATSTIENCYDITLENEDYTIGKVLEFILYEKYYVGEKTLSFCGFKKLHPHNSESTIRIAFTEPSDKTRVREYFQNVATMSGEIFKTINGLFV